MTAILAAVLPNLLPLVGSLLGLGLTWLTLQLKNKIAADEKAQKYGVALQRLVDLTMTYGQRVWPKLEAEFKLAMVDGALSQDERTHLEDILKAEVLLTFSKEELEKLATDLGLPFAGLISQIATRLLNLVIQAHDPAIPQIPQALFALPPPGQSAAADPSQGMG